MKRLSFLLIMAATVVTTLAQSLNIHEGCVTYSYPYDETTQMTYSTNTLTINGEDYLLSQITSITGSEQQMEASQVVVNYEGNTASVVMSGELRGRVTATINGANVSLTDMASAEDGEPAEVTYRLSGAATDGSFLQTGAYKCTISLEGINLQSNACPMQVDNGKRINFIVADGTQNTFTDGSNNFRKSAFWVKGHAEFTGAGTLSISGTQRHAYSSNEYTLLKHSFTGEFNILTAVSDGMHVDQYYEQRNGNVTFANIQGDNIDVTATTNEADEQNGQVIVSGGKIVAKATAADSKCVKNTGDMLIAGGRLELICSGDGTKGLSVGGNLTIEQDMTAAANTLPYIYMYASGNEYVNPSDATDTSKCRGIKVKGNLTYNGGTLERDINSTIKATKIISIDGTYTYMKGEFKNCSISQ